MADVINCPACAAQFPYMPDLAGMRIDCPNCRHPFTVTAPPRTSRMPIAIPPAPAPRVVQVTPTLSLPEPEAQGETETTPGQVLAAAQPAPHLVAPTERAFNNPFLPIAEKLDQPLRGLDIDLSLPDDGQPDETNSHDDTDFALPSEFDNHDEGPLTHDGVLPRAGNVTPLGLEPPEGVRMIEGPPAPPPPQVVRDLALTTDTSQPSKPRPRPRVKFKPPPRQWTTADRAVFNIALVIIVIAIFFLLMPITGVEVNSATRLGEAAPLAATLVIIVGIVTCVTVAFRQFAKWVFLGTSGVFGLTIIALFTYAAIKSPGSYDAPAIAQSDSKLATSPATTTTATIASTLATNEQSPSPPQPRGEGGRIAYEALSLRYGPQRVVRISVPAPDKQAPDATLATKAHESLSALAPAWHVSRKDDDHLECILAPVEDFDTLIDQIQSTVAKPTDVDPNQRKLTLRLPQ